MCSQTKTNPSTSGFLPEIERLAQAIKSADTIIIGAGAGLSTSAGFVYTGLRFRKYFGDFSAKYGFKDMYSGGFYPYKTPQEEWAYWSRYVYINRYMNAPKDCYEKLYKLIKDKDYFVLTTNVDHCFQKAGFNKERLFYTQGDYGLFQCSKPCHDKTYDNFDIIKKLVSAQGYKIGGGGELIPPKGMAPLMSVPKSLVPVCPVCGRRMNMNLRADMTFVEDEGWHEASKRYSEFLDAHEGGKTLFLELGVGYNTPGIIKIPFMRMTRDNRNAVYASLNLGEAYAPDEIKPRSILINGDIDEVLTSLTGIKA